MNPLLIEPLFELGKKIIAKLFPDPEKAAEANLKLAELQQNGELALLTAEVTLASGQQNINLEEAKSESLFKSGWRPFVGWTCGFAFAYHFVLQPFLIFFLAVFGVVVTIPTLDIGSLITVLLGMLGLGTLRTYEKKNGIGA